MRFHKKTKQTNKQKQAANLGIQKKYEKGSLFLSWIGRNKQWMLHVKSIC